MAFGLRAMHFLLLTLILAAFADAPEEADQADPDADESPIEVAVPEETPGDGATPETIPPDSDESGVPGGSEPPPALSEEPTVPPPTVEAPIAGEVPVAVPSPSEPEPFGRLLEEGKRIYFEGGHSEALETLVGLQKRLHEGEVVPEEMSAETLLYLGEIQLKLGDETAAWATYEWLLRRNPEQTISPFLHPADAVLWFNQVKKYVQRSIANEKPPEPPPPVPPLPVWAYAPFGVPQYQQGRVGAGVAYTTLSVAFAATSIGAYIDIARLNREGSIGEFSAESLARRVTIERYAVQWPATLGFYGLWVASYLQGRRTWHQQHALSVSLTFVPDPRRPGLFLSSRF